MILNMTQHPASTEQVESGVVEPSADTKAEIRALLTFDELPTRQEVVERARSLAEVARREGADSAMIGGAPFLMGALEAALKEVGVKPIFAFSRRESVEAVQPDGSVVKKAVFRHLGFVEG